jgi:DNA-binding transcriptional regulator YhcF (GntR family)
MEFNNQKAIYLQIADLICAQILSGRWAEDERIPSVREYASQLEVNPNTVMKAFEELQQKEIITMRRGMGYYVSNASVERTRKFLKEEFIQLDLPAIFARMKMTGFTLEEFNKAFNEFIQSSNPDTL